MIFIQSLYGFYELLPHWPCNHPLHVGCGCLPWFLLFRCIAHLIPFVLPNCFIPRFERIVSQQTFRDRTAVPSASTIVSKDPR